MNDIDRWGEPALWYGSLRRFADGGYVKHDDHLTFVNDAVNAERERCAKIVSDLSLEEFKSGPDHNLLVFIVSEINECVPARPAQDFAVGDEVFISAPLHFFNGVRGTITSIRRMPNPDPYYVVLLPGERREEIWLRRKDLSLHVPPTPAELIPTLVEHEYVRGTTDDGRSFEGFTHLHYGVMVAGEVLLLLPLNSTYGHVATIERCDQPVVL